ncbi:serine/threonine-protein kinase BLUS1 [Capsella rubella]|uniref:serine/threonine-protein kinase BLUS1 n=1 Tax=Capsella rubella TaxID=81985 RepID=UPI000CD56583|nr:serine/threonine-protein kinase BLUS1 [Capsella rubella]XP_023644118.1 serine/threonine-protein kinase BLUS1 [Capsella rubella]XP_023644119.1 serine/threonine-protein kinase BLUS1 [Capsella rubella]
MAGSSSSSSKRFPLYAKDYELFEEVGEGVSATVYRARCIALNEIVAVKILDLEKCRNDLETIRKEVHIMNLIDHPNLLRAHCSFIDSSSLWIVMPYMSGGSCFHLMKSVFPDGLEQPIIATLLREVLKALVYLHRQGHIHRDVKAGNILIHSRGVVKLGDFGVSACMFESGERMRPRNTFVGTPCWMAPEVMQQVDGYDFKADIWSFGITALELAHGHAPFSKYPPMKVLLMTLQNAPPRLDYERDKKFSKSFRELIAACLVKDPKKRPTSAKLLKHPFFKHARSTDYLSRKILHGLSPLGERFQNLKEAEAELFKGINGDKEQLSQHEYMRGISAWNFDLEDLRRQASLISNDEMCNSEIQELNENGEVELDVPKRNTVVQRSQTSSECHSEKDMMSESESQSTSPLLPTLGEGTEEKLVPEEPHLLEPLADTKQVNKAGHEPEKPKNGYTVSPVNQTSCAATEILPLLQSLLVQNDIQRAKVIRLIRLFDGSAAETGRSHIPKVEGVQIYPSKEKDLQSHVQFLEQSVDKLVDEVQRRKDINSQLEQQINSLINSNNIP